MRFKTTSHLTVVRAVTTRQEAWVENHVHSISQNSTGHVIDRWRKTRVHLIDNLTSVNQHNK